jgi:hypothetical protein
MKPPTSARSAERSSKKTSRRRPTRNRHNLLPMKKNQMNNQPVVVGPQSPLVGLKVPRADQAGHLEGAEDDGPRKA